MLDSQTRITEISGGQSQQWYAMRATYHREMAVKDLLEKQQIECYLPMARKLKVTHGRKTCVMSPIISNLIFVHASKDTIQHFKTRVTHLQYMTTSIGGKNVPIVVPEKQMADFIAITKHASERISFFTPGELDISRGSRVKIHGGVFDGIEGTFMKISGKRNRCVVIEVRNVLSIALDSAGFSMIELV